MLETPHVALGAVIAKAIPNPLISIPLSFVSHFFLDMTPHWNPHLNTELKQKGKLSKQTLLIIGLDLASTILLTGYFANKSVPDTKLVTNIVLCSLASILPDVVEGPYFLLGWRNKFIEKWVKYQKMIQVDANLFWGLVTQIITLGACFFYLSI